MELFSIIIAEGIFVIAWNSRKNIENSFFIVFGISSFFVGAFDLIHTISYKGMGIFLEYDANLPTQLWISARYIQAISILLAITLVNKKINLYALFIGYLIICFFLITSVFLRVFPDCYIEGTGLTSFKINSEYIIILILIITALLLIKLRSDFDKRMSFLIILSIAANIISELAFTFYVSVYGLSNIIGHIFKIITFYLIYKAIIQKGLRNPLNSLFLKLKRSEQSYKEAYDRASFYKDIFAHDIRNIIQNIYMSVEFIKQNSSVTKDMIKVIDEQIYKAKNLISNVQNLSEIEISKTILKKIEIIKKLKQVSDSLYQSFPEKNLEIKQDFYSNEIFVLADDLIVNVFENILINAILYNEKDSVEITIKVSEFEENKISFIKLEFIDNARGIIDTRKKIIFQRGFKEEKGSKGMGLGLSLVNNIIDSYNSKIWIEDRVKGDYSKGSNFIILLPKVIM